MHYTGFSSRIFLVLAVCYSSTMTFSGVYAQEQSRSSNVLLSDFSSLPRLDSIHSGVRQHTDTALHCKGTIPEAPLSAHEIIISDSTAWQKLERMKLLQQLANAHSLVELSSLLYENELDKASLLNEQVAREEAMKELALLQAALKAEKQQTIIYSLESDRSARLMEFAQLHLRQDERDKGLVLLQKENELLESQKKLKEVELKRNMTLKNFGITAGSLLMCILLMVSHGLITTKKKNKLIAQQSRSIGLINHQLKEQNDGILSGINYARHFQESIVPGEEVLRSYVPDGFMIHLPLDIVSGDIPYFEKRGRELFIGAIDCIGHGVPAAMLSFMVHYNLKELVSEKPNFSCGELLGMLHKRMLQALKQQTQKPDFNAGVDLALCKINLDTQEIQYAGAQIPLLIIGKNNKERIKGDVFSIGDVCVDNLPHFITHNRYLSKSDRVYLCTDGFIHQFGGTSGDKKFSMASLMGKLQALHHQPMGFIKEDLIRAFNDWKGSIDQTDDIMLLGLSFDR